MFNIPDTTNFDERILSYPASSAYGPPSRYNEIPNYNNSGSLGGALANVNFPIVTGVFSPGLALNCLGSSTSGEIPYNTGLALGNFTIEMYLRNNGWTLDYTHILDSAFDSGIRFTRFSNGDKLYMYIFGVGNTMTTNSTLPLYTWKHVAITRSGNVGKYIVNGVVDVTATVNSQTLTSRYPIYIGQNGTEQAGYYYFSGNIKNLRIWNYARRHNRFSLRWMLLSQVAILD